MTTLADLRSALRTLLNDTAAGGYLWSDEMLNRHLADAVREYSRLFPRELTANVALVAGQQEYDLPVGCERVLRVEVVEDLWVLVEGGDSDGVGYQLFAGKLILLPKPTAGGKNLNLRYLAAHSSLANDADVSTVPAADEDLLLASACAAALQTLSMEEAKRQRFEQGTGRSAEAAAALYRQQYERGIRDRAARVRSGRLVARD